MSAQRIRRPEMRRAVVLFPSGLTLGNLFFGFFAIVAASRGDFSYAGLYVVLGGVCDAFDGRVARVTGSGSRFGEELDSLVDAVTFGLAPAMIMYFAVLNKNGFDWIFGFIFTTCAVMRLARFNVSQAGTDKRYFQGLPSPAAGITLASYYWFSQSPLYTETFVTDWPWHRVVRFLMLGLGALMFSSVPYPVVPKLSLRNIEGWFGVAFVLGGVSMLVLRRWEWFFPLAMVYVLFGLARAGILGLLERQRSPDALDQDEIEDTVPRLALEDAQDAEYERYPARRAPSAPRRPTPHATAVLPQDASPVDEARAARRRKRRRRPRGDRSGGPGKPDSPPTDFSVE